MGRGNRVPTRMRRGAVAALLAAESAYYGAEYASLRQSNLNPFSTAPDIDAPSP